MAERLQQLEDKQAVIEVIYQYSHGINSKNRELWLDVFTEDGSWAAKSTPEGGWSFKVRGQSALRGWYDEHARDWPPGSEGHIVSGPCVTLSGDEAEAKSYYLTLLRVDGGPGLRSTGLYWDRLVRCPDGKWRIAKRRAIGNISHGS
jgi:hypothetical protein